MAEPSRDVSSVITNGPASVPKPLRAYDAFRRLVRLNTVQADAKLQRFIADSLIGSTIVIEGKPVDPYDLVIQACGDAIQKGMTPNSINQGLSLLRAIVDRCARDEKWPGQYAKDEPFGQPQASAGLARARQLSGLTGA